MIFIIQRDLQLIQQVYLKFLIGSLLITYQTKIFYKDPFTSSVI